MSRLSGALPRRLLCLLLAAGALATSLPALSEESCYGSLGRFPFQYRGMPMMPAVDGEIDGKPAVILVDTGAHGSMLTMTGAMRRDLPLKLSPRQIVGVGGQSNQYTTRISNFAVGKVGSAAMSIDVIGQTGVPIAYDAIIGVDFLLQADLEVDFSNRQLRLLKPMSCGPNEHLAYWDRNASVLPALPNYSGMNAFPHFIVELNGVRMNAIIDTGASSTVVIDTAARRAGVFPHSPGVKLVGAAGGWGQKRGRAWVARFDDIRIGKELLVGPTLNIQEVPKESRGNWDILLGNDFLRAYRVLFATSQKRIYLSRIGIPFPPRQGSADAWVAQEAAGGNPDAHLTMARYAGDANDAEGSLRWTRSAAGLGQPLAQRLIGARAWREGRAAEAVAALEPSVAKMPADIDAQIELYLALLKAGKADQASQQLNKAAPLFRHDPWAQRMLGYMQGTNSLDQVLTTTINGSMMVDRMCPALDYDRWLRQIKPGLPPVSDQANKIWALCPVLSKFGLSPLTHYDPPAIAPPAAEQPAAAEPAAAAKEKTDD
ncbi:MAG: retroviral-like aspartic protease family protein [Massilia sp.]